MKFITFLLCFIYFNENLLKCQDLKYVDLFYERKANNRTHDIGNIFFCNISNIRFPQKNWHGNQKSENCDQIKWAQLIEIIS